MAIKIKETKNPTYSIYKTMQKTGKSIDMAEKLLNMFQ